MILAPYRNPPYKTPRPANLNPGRSSSSSSSSSSSNHEALMGSEMRTPSPKRKRPDLTAEDANEGNQSPRTNVAERLSDLDLARAGSPSPRKKVKRTVTTTDSVTSEQLEVRETPQMQRRASPPPAPASPTPHSPPSTTLSLSPPATSTSTSPPSSSDAESLAFWHFSEITGHLALTPDDDGEGLNGVGFRPTPQIAEARAQKRRRQVAEWKAREAREARGRRIERRNRVEGEKGGGGEGGEKGGRTVRFDVGGA